MWHPIEISFKNLFSHEHTTFKFVQGQMLMLIGPNGIGKSTIIEAITLAVTGDVYRKVSKDDFVRDGEQETWVKFTLKNNVTKQTFAIERTICLGNGTSIKLYENKTLKTDLLDGRNGDANKYIFTKLGITKEDFLDYFVIGQGNHNSFFAAGDAKQKEIISRFSNSSMVDSVIDKVDTDIKVLNEQLLEAKNYLANRHELIVYIQGEINNLQQNKQLEFDEKKLELQERIVGIKDKENKINVLKNELLKLRPKCKSNDELPEEELNEIKVEIEKCEKTLKTHKQILTQWEIIKSELEIKSGRIIKCPKCKFEFVADSTVTKKEVQDYIKEANDNIKLVTKLLGNCRIELGELESGFEKVELEVQATKNTQQRVAEIESSIKIMQERLNLYREQLTAKQDELSQLQQPSYQKELKAKQAKLNEFKRDIETWEQTEANLLQQKETLLFHQFHFGRKGFKTYLANKSIRNLQDITNYYLQKFEIDLQVQISGFKVLKNGDIRDKIETSIIKNGRRRGLFHKFSGGEKSRVDLAGIISVHKLINNSSETGGLDLLAIDESVSYLDKQGQQEIVDILAKAGITSILVMHMDTEIAYAGAVRFQKIDGITKMI